jgi:antitoxin component YwqK of YwqJK toxin-antitoxin module
MMDSKALSRPALSKTHTVVPNPMRTVIIFFIFFLPLSHFSLGKSFSVPNVKDSVEIIDYYSNGNKKLEGWYVVDFTKDDTLYLATGKQIKYYKSGKVQAYQYFEQGVLNGEFQSYYEHGNKEKTFCYKNGKLNGPYTFYYPDGVVMRIGTFKNDTDFGISRRYYKNGKLALEEFYNEDGIQEGEVKYYNKTGDLKRIEILYNGKKKKD